MLMMDFFLQVVTAQIIDENVSGHEETPILKPGQKAKNSEKWGQIWQVSVKVSSI